MKKIFTMAMCVLSLNTFAQMLTVGIPDSVKNVTRAGSSGQYAITNPLNYNGSNFTNGPWTQSCISSCKSDYLCFYDLDLKVPAYATITGIEVVHTKGGCNSGSYNIDTMRLAFNGAMISQPKRDSTSNGGTAIHGSSSDTWGAALTPAIVNSNKFGLFLYSTGNGVCTIVQQHIEVIVYYCGENSGVPDSLKNMYRPGANGAYSFASNGIGHNGNGFINAPNIVGFPVTPTNTGFCNRTSNLYFYDFHMNVPVGANITGAQVIHYRGACNPGGYVIDTLQLAYNNAVIGNVKRDSTYLFKSDTLGSSLDNWGTSLSPTLVNSPTFGIFVNSSVKGTDGCTYLQYNLQLNIYYTCANGALGVANGLSRNTQDALIFPNPVREAFNLKVSRETVGSVYSVYDYTGRVVATGNIVDELTALSSVNLTKGVYFIRINSTQPQTLRFVKD